MSEAEKIAQWVIDNRYAKSENDKISDSEMYNILVAKIIDFHKHMIESVSDEYIKFGLTIDEEIGAKWLKRHYLKQLES